MCRPLDAIEMGEIPEPSEYELIREANIEEKKSKISDLKTLKFF